MRTKQCKACPWKKSTRPTRDIPGGYGVELHRGLACTIAAPGEVRIGGVMRMMACHETTGGDEQPCVGWVVNQLGPGNSIQLRMMARDGRFKDYRTVGAQHERFADTLPRDEEE